MNLPEDGSSMRVYKDLSLKVAQEIKKLPELLEAPGVHQDLRI